MRSMNKMALSDTDLGRTRASECCILDLASCRSLEISKGRGYFVQVPVDRKKMKTCCCCCCPRHSDTVCNGNRSSSMSLCSVLIDRHCDERIKICMSSYMYLPMHEMAEHRIQLS